MSHHVVSSAAIKNDASATPFLLPQPPIAATTHNILQVERVQTAIQVINRVATILPFAAAESTMATAQMPILTVNMGRTIVR